MLRFLFALAAVVFLASGCARPSPRELLDSTSFLLAREHGRFERVLDMDVFAITLGSGPDVLLLHGNPASSYTWRKILRPLSKEHRVHAIDLPGFGFSDKPSDVRYSPGWLAKVVVAYMDVAGIERAALVGSSMGGHVASEVAILYPRRVSALVLIAASGLAPRPGATTPDPPLALRIASWPLIGRLLASLPARPLVASALRSSVADPNTVTEADVDAYYAPLRSRNGLTAFLRLLHDTPDVGRDELVTMIRAPTLVITGDQDRLVPPSVARRYHKTIRGSRLVVMNDTGHLPHEERPEAVLALLRPFLRRPD